MMQILYSQITIILKTPNSTKKDMIFQKILDHIIN